ncbi:uncharacterized protein LOC127102305 [Lathyrus oleraceus]|uniref:uncharacterized protein LOC127102305 n=1 Tax=Pisum sativum TaxID=3888 RepID=UPI0021CF5242|nr:uncharacterized protein LOC127102305 [Pisum sativum]
MVYKFHKTLYGLKQARRACNLNIDSFFKRQEFRKCEMEYGVYVQHTSDSSIILLKYKLELLKRFELTNCKFAITHTETNHKLDSDDVGATTCKQLDLKIKVSKPVRLMIVNKSTIRLTKNPMLHGRSKHIDTKFHFLRNQVQNIVLEIVHCSIQKQLADMLTKAIKIEHFINLRDVIGVVDFSLECGLKNDIKV